MFATIHKKVTEGGALKSLESYLFHIYTEKFLLRANTNLGF